ncbi:MAG: hypothetical protein B6242_14725 [Anaerolineaceae bacterium 4572_78]|nr:MAG: hypothetical protein B6242_14725 [Anaerolineaceae bacterium 4572_78]
MERTHLENRITFLDQAYRRSRTELEELQHQLELNESEKVELYDRVQSLEKELTEVRALLSQFNTIERKMERFQTDMLKALQEQQTKQTQALRDTAQSRQMELQGLNRSINNLRRELEKLINLDELVALSRAETERQATILNSVQQRFDELERNTEEQVRPIKFIEDTQRSDTRRINELISQANEQGRKIDLQVAKIDLLEKQIPQFGEFQLALEATRENIRTQVDKLQYQYIQVERTVKSWDGFSEGVNRRLDEYESRMVRYAEHYQRNLKALDALQAFQEKLQRSQHEFSELQRLSVDRKLSELNDWQAAFDLKFKRRSVEYGEQFQEFARRVDRFERDIQTTASQIPSMNTQFTLLLKILEEDMLTRASMAKDWQARFEEILTEDGQI